MRRRRFRRSRGVWLPIYGNRNQGAELDAVLGGAGSVLVENNGTVTTDAFPVTFDQQHNPFLTQVDPAEATGFGGQTLRDLVAGGEWRCRRLVGKLHGIFSSEYVTEGGNYLDVPPACEVAVGFIVCNVNDENVLETDLDEVNPLTMESADDPWIWRRKWILSNAGLNWSKTGQDAGTFGKPEYHQYKNMAFNWPLSTAAYGSVADGPHIDQKTARRIHRSQRLFCMISTRLWNPMGTVFSPSVYFETNGYFYYNLDLRLFGSIASSMGNRGNAAR